MQPTGNNTDKVKQKPSDIAGKINTTKEPWEESGEPNQANYGFSQGADLDSENEETEEQEYAADGLSRTQKYTVDRVGRSHDEGKPGSVENDRRGRSDCGC